MRDDEKVSGNIYLSEEDGKESNSKILSIVNAEDKESTLCKVNSKVGEEDLLCIDNTMKNRKRIIIEKLVLENFKSYSGVKVIGPFYKKFSCIVGPNGSGKSNIIDAMLFVFGRRAKKIRQNRLCDLIHNSKYSMNNEYTKVSIYFKTIRDEEEGAEEQHQLGEQHQQGEQHHLESKKGLKDSQDNTLGPLEKSTHESDNSAESESENFIISREATIDNQSKYRINDKVVNQKEVVDLLYKKGIDLNNNRFLILQGEVEQIAQMNPKGNKNDEGLLEYLEDIIGTNEYIESINENFEKLEKFEEVYHERVNRLKHVYNELKELVTPKKEAKYYMDLQKYTYKLHILIYKKEQYELAKLMVNKENELHGYIEKRDNHNKEYKELLEERKNMNIALSKLENEEEEIIKKKNKADNEFKKLTTHDENIKKELIVIVEKMQNLYVKREELKEKKIPLYKKIIQEKQKESNEIKKNKLPKLEQELEKCEEELEKYNEDIKQDTDKINTIYSIEEKKLAPLQNYYDNLIKSTSECTNKCNIIEKKQKEYLTHIENLKYLQSKILNELKEKDIQSKHMLKLEDEKKKMVKYKEIQIDELKKKIEKLNSTLIKEQVTYETIKKEVVTDKTTNKLHEFIYNLKKTKIKNIHGMLGDLGYIDKKYEKAFLIAGNNCSDFVIVENPNDAVLLFEEIRKHNLGRVNVLSLSILEKNLMQTMLKNEENYTPLLPNVHRLIDFIKFKNEKYKICFYFALKETLLANSLDEAHVIGYSHKKRVVTLNGELIENDGRICGGGLSKHLKSGRENRHSASNHGSNSNSSTGIGIKTSEYDESDLLKVEKTVEELNKNMDELKTQKSILQNDIKDLNSFIEDNECKLEITKKRIDNCKKQLQDIDEQLQNSEVPQLTKEEENELNALKELIEEKNNEKSKIEIILKAQENKVKKYYEQLQNVGGEKKKNLKNKYINAERQLNIVKDELQKYNNDEVNALANLEKGEKDIIKFTEEIVEYENNEKELENELKHVETKGCTIYEEVEELSKQLNDMQKKIEENQKKKQIIDENISKKDLENVDIVYKIKHTQKEIEEFKDKRKYYQSKIDEYMDLIQQSDKIIRENMLSHVKNGKNVHAGGAASQRADSPHSDKDEDEQEDNDEEEEDDDEEAEDDDENEEDDDEEAEDDDEDEEDDDEDEEDDDEDEEDDDEEEEDDDEKAEDKDADEESTGDEEQKEKEKCEGGEGSKEKLKPSEGGHEIMCLTNSEEGKKRRIYHSDETKDPHKQKKRKNEKNRKNKNKNKNKNKSKNMNKKGKNRKEKKRKEDDDEDNELKELEDMYDENQEFQEIDNKYDYVNIKDEELEVLNKKEIETKLENKIHILEKKAPNLKIFQDYNIKLYDYKKRRKDVKKSKKEKDKIKKVYDSLCNKRREEFLVAFNIISSKLKEMYQMIAIGGDAELEIIDSSEIFNEGILFSVRPPKKSWKHIQNLSGGEKTLSSLALVFALHYFKPNPIYFMDEIDAALDFKNVSIISHYIKTKTNDAQFIVISLRNQMFELCDRMIGIYKTNDITKCITLNPSKFQEDQSS
ncbi:chromosome condensation protein, putative [Plasmodium malariae]|uniref:Structural maintenance of chromosomes protein 4 n=1 Tax=Plasmodium malariae TaxID=5858 RepID=A0A1A8W5M4_PLAMA|nr:chromosome condensation protein, putative [Plasmodium malariae]